MGFMLCNNALRAHYYCRTPRPSRLLGTLHKMFHGETRGASHYGLAVYIEKHLKAKKEL